MPHRYYIMTVAWVCLQTLPPVSCSLHLDVLEGVLTPASTTLCVWQLPFPCFLQTFPTAESANSVLPAAQPWIILLFFSHVRANTSSSNFWTHSQYHCSAITLTHVCTEPTQKATELSFQPWPCQSVPNTRLKRNHITLLFRGSHSIPSESKRQPSYTSRTGMWPDCLPFLPHCFPCAVFPQRLEFTLPSL